MTSVTRLVPLCTGLHRYDKSLSTRGRGQGTSITAPILAYLVETVHGRVLYDLGCDYAKIADAQACARHYGAASFPFGPPQMAAEQRLPDQLRRLGLDPDDIDAVVVGHLHFDHAGGLADFRHADIHVHGDELEAARCNADGAYFADDFAGDHHWRISRGDVDLGPGLRTIASPGHTAGHRSLWIERPYGRPVILAGDAADLQENLDDEIAPGLCWRDRDDLALASIRTLKDAARSSGAWLWPNHDIAHWRRLEAGSW